MAYYHDKKGDSDEDLTMEELLRYSFTKSVQRSPVGQSTQFNITDPSSSRASTPIRPTSPLTPRAQSPLSLQSPKKPPRKSPATIKPSTPEQILESLLIPIPNRILSVSRPTDSDYIQLWMYMGLLRACQILGQPSLIAKITGVPFIATLYYGRSDAEKSFNDLLEMLPCHPGKQQEVFLKIALTSSKREFMVRTGVLTHLFDSFPYDLPNLPKKQETAHGWVQYLQGPFPDPNELTYKVDDLGILGKSGFLAYVRWAKQRHPEEDTQQDPKPRFRSETPPQDSQEEDTIIEKDQTLEESVRYVVSEANREIQIDRKEEENFSVRLEDDIKRFKKIIDDFPVGSPGEQERGTSSTKHSLCVRCRGGDETLDMLIDNDTSGALKNMLKMKCEPLSTLYLADIERAYTAIARANKLDQVGRRYCNDTLRFQKELERIYNDYLLTTILASGNYTREALAEKDTERAPIVERVLEGMAAMLATGTIVNALEKNTKLVEDMHGWMRSGGARFGMADLSMNRPENKVVEAPTQSSKTSTKQDEVPRRALPVIVDCSARLFNKK